jgi:toxin HigB-1
LQVEFGTDELRRLFEDTSFAPPGLGADLVKAYRKRVQMLIAAADERDLYAMKSLHYEKLKGKRAHQRSIKLNDQWRLVMRTESGDDGRVIILIEIIDYH